LSIPITYPGKTCDTLEDRDKTNFAESVATSAGVDKSYSTFDNCTTSTRRRLTDDVALNMGASLSIPLTTAEEGDAPSTLQYFAEKVKNDVTDSVIASLDSGTFQTALVELYVAQDVIDPPATPVDYSTLDVTKAVTTSDVSAVFAPTATPTVMPTVAPSVLAAGSSSSGDDSTVLIIVLCVVGGLVLVGGAGGVVYYQQSNAEYRGASVVPVGKGNNVVAPFEGEDVAL
jgi:hypothetical protein